jgi:hypothetical protein
MSSPTGPEQNHPQGGAPQGQPGFGAPPPPPAGYNPSGYAGPSYDPAPSYGGQPGYGAGADRPPQVLAAAIMGFVVGALALLGGLGFFALASIFALFAVFGILYLALAGLNIWGGVLALQGKGSTILKIAGLITAGLAILGWIFALTQTGFDFWSLLMAAVGIGIFVLLNQPVSQQWFASRGTR